MTVPLVKACWYFRKQNNQEINKAIKWFLSPTRTGWLGGGWWWLCPRCCGRGSPGGFSSLSRRTLATEWRCDDRHLAPARKWNELWNEGNRWWGKSGPCRHMGMRNISKKFTKMLKDVMTNSTYFSTTKTKMFVIGPLRSCSHLIFWLSADFASVPLDLLQTFLPLCVFDPVTDDGPVLPDVVLKALKEKDIRHVQKL